MNAFQKCVVSLVSNAISSEQVPYEKCNLPWDKLVLFAKKQKISSQILYAVKKLNLEIPQKSLENLEKDVFQHIMLFEQQLYELARIEEAFQSAGIDYMLLKGLNVHKYYSKELVRMMKDLDILIRIEQYGEIKCILTGLGFKECKETNHELIWKKGNVILELHKYIESPYNKDYFNYFKDGWSFAKKVDGSSKHYLSPEDEFVFLLTHFAGHYRSSGIDILHFVDLWLYKINNADMDEQLIESALIKLNLLNFYNSVIKTLNAWFSGGEEDRITDIITGNIFTKGVNRKYSVSVISGEARKRRLTDKKKTSKFSIVLHMLFPSCDVLKYSNPILIKAPYLLPFVWVLRCLKLIANPKKIKEASKRLKCVNNENIDNYLNDIKAVGLDFSKL